MWPWTGMSSTPYSLSSERIALNSHKLKGFLSAHPLSSCLFCFFACSCYRDGTVSWKAEHYLLSCRCRESSSTQEGQNCRGVGTQGVQRFGVWEIGAVFLLETEEWYRLGQTGEHRPEELRYWMEASGWEARRGGGSMEWQSSLEGVIRGGPGRGGSRAQVTWAHTAGQWDLQMALLWCLVLLLKHLCWNHSRGKGRRTKLKSPAKKQ